MARLQQSEVQELPILIKADVQGSAEALTQALEKAGNEECAPASSYSAPGGVSEADVQLAKASGAPIFAFNVRANKQARELAEAEKVEIRYYSIIYDVIDDVKRRRWKAFWHRRNAKPSSVMRKSWKSSTSPSWARWPVAA